MQHKLWLLVAFLLFACQPQQTSKPIYIFNGDALISIASNADTPQGAFNQAGLTLEPKDRVLFNGHPIALNQTFPKADSIALQIRHPVTLTLIIPNGQQKFKSSAFTVGEALAEAAYWLRASDNITPSLSSPIKAGMTITVSAPRNLTVSVDGQRLQIPSSARTVGEALAEAGIPLLGQDYSLPAGSEALPYDGHIKVVRVHDTVILVQKPIPFDSELVASADVTLDQTQILQPGETGLSLQRVRIHYEDGQEISRTTENNTTVRPPKTRVLGYGTKVEIKTTVVGGTKIEYWRAVQMYATSYSPCRSGVPNCGSTTSSGKTVKRGYVALRLSWYLAMRGQRLYIPGYGFASVEDVCGGCVGKPWIDLGYSDTDYQQWNSWVTVYFLTPVPSNIIYAMQ